MAVAIDVAAIRKAYPGCPSNTKAGYKLSNERDPTNIDICASDDSTVNTRPAKYGEDLAYSLQVAVRRS